MTVALQRVIVRMLFDERFRARVYADPAGSLGGLGIEPRAFGWLTRHDPRAWRTDPHRRARALTALLGEFPATAALAARAAASPRHGARAARSGNPAASPRHGARAARSGNPAGGAAALDAFFSSLDFHAAIQRGGSMAASFGAWLGARGAILGADGPAITALAEIESGLARAARARRRASAPGTLALGAHRELLEGTPAGSLELLVAVRTALGTDAIAAIIEGRPLGALPRLAQVAEPLLIVAEGEPRLEPLPESLAALLSFATEPRTRDALLAKTIELGATPSEAEEIIAELEAEKTLA